MLDQLFGEAGSRVLLFIRALGDGYAREIAGNFALALSTVQHQLARFESAGVLASRTRGTVRLYQFNPRYPFLRELQQLLDRALEYTPELERKKYYERRTRPRRVGKPL